MAELAPCLLDLHANRLLSADARCQEMVPYDFLDQLDDARAAQTRTAAPP